MDRDGLLAVADDLKFLSGWGPEIADGDIRRGSATLRRLLVEDAYGMAWRAVGFARQPTLVAVDLWNLVPSDSINIIEFALAAGAEFRGVYLAAMVVNRGNTAPPAPNPAVLRSDGYPGERQYELSEYMGSVSGIVGGLTFTRRDVIKYIANVKGGVHLSPKQRKREEKLVNRLGKIEKKMMVHNSDGLLVELVAIAQAVGRSDDSRTYVEKVES